MHTRRVAIAFAFTVATCLPLTASSAATPPSPCPTKPSAWPSLEVGTRAGSNRPDITIIAPHGNFDRNTKDLALLIGELTGAQVVWATDSKASMMRRINVNRPTEMRWGVERKTRTALDVFTLFSACVTRHTSRMSVEIHGDSSEDVMEMATVGVGVDEAGMMKDAWDHRFGLPIAIDAAGDDLTMSAGSNKRIGLMSKCTAMCLHLEVPRSLRDPEVLRHTATELAAFFTAIAP